MPANSTFEFEWGNFRVSLVPLRPRPRKTHTVRNTYHFFLEVDNQPSSHLSYEDHHEASEVLETKREERTIINQPLGSLHVTTQLFLYTRSHWKLQQLANIFQCLQASSAVRNALPCERLKDKYKEKLQFTRPVHFSTSPIRPTTARLQEAEGSWAESASVIPAGTPLPTPSSITSPLWPLLFEICPPQASTTTEHWDIPNARTHGVAIPSFTYVHAPNKQEPISRLRVMKPVFTSSLTEGKFHIGEAFGERSWHTGCSWLSLSQLMHFPRKQNCCCRGFHNLCQEFNLHR